MATPKKKNGKWHIQVYVGKDDAGKRVYKRITADTKDQAMYQALLIKTQGVPEKKTTRTVRDVVEEYIQSVEAVISPTTLRGYKVAFNNGFQPLMEKPVDELDNACVQNAISEESKRITRHGKRINPKTLANEWGLIETALRRICGKTYQVKLPQVPAKIKTFPTPEEIMQAIKGTTSELPCLLAMWLSLSMSEIKGLDCASIREGVLHIEQVRIKVDGKEQVKKATKVESRTRSIAVPDYIMSLINNTTTYKNFRQTGENQPLIPTTRNRIYKRWKKIAESHGWAMTFHDLRAVFASTCLMLGIPDKYALQKGGWASDYVYRRTYQQFFDEERIKVDRRIDDYFNQFI